MNTRKKHKEVLMLGPGFIIECGTVESLANLIGLLVSDGIPFEKDLTDLTVTFTGTREALNLLLIRCPGGYKISGAPRGGDHG